MSERKKRWRVQLFLFLLAAQVLMVAAIWSHHHVLLSVYDTAVVDLAGRWIGSQKKREPLRVLLFHSLATADFLEDSSQQLRLVNQWRDFLLDHNITSTVVSDWPTDEEKSNYDLLILPSTTCMSNSDIDWVKGFLSKGKGVIMSWAPGVRDEKGKWRSSSLLEHVGGMQLANAVPLEGDPPVGIMHLNAFSPLTAGLPLGLSLQVQAYGEPLATKVVESRVMSSGSWGVGHEDLVMNGASSSSNTGKTALAHGSYMDGRFVWLGFTDFSAVDHSEHRQTAQHIILNAVQWAGRLPRISKPVWPHHAESAFSLSLKVQQAEDLDIRLLELAHVHNIPVTLYTPFDLLSGNSLQIDWQSRGLEFALLDAKPARQESDIHLRNEQRRLRSLNNSLRAYTERRLTGYRAQDGHIEELLLDGLVRAQFNYVTVAETGDIHPRIIRTHRPIPLLTRLHELWLLPEILFYNISQQHHTSLRAELIKRFLEVHAQGGYFNLVIHDAVDDSTLESLDFFFHEIKEMGVWMASLKAVYTHWKAVSHLSIAVTHGISGRISIHISNSGQENVSNASFFLELDEHHERISLRPITLGSPLPQTTSSDGHLWELTLSNIPPGKNYSYHLELR